MEVSLGQLVFVDVKQKCWILNCHHYMKHETKLSISDAKKADLLSLCKTGVIPPIYHTFYEHLPSGKSVKDTLPQPDVTEEDVICD